jgi:hypothetical protein
MNKYKYQIYDYSKVGIEKKKFFVRKELTNQEWETIKTITYTPDDAALVLYRELKKVYYDAKPNYKYDPNIDWDWEIITPEKTYNFK